MTHRARTFYTIRFHFPGYGVVLIYTGYLLFFFQFTEEKFGQAEKTELDAHLENLLVRAENTKQWTERIMKQTEVLLQPNPSKTALFCLKWTWLIWQIECWHRGTPFQGSVCVCVLPTMGRKAPNPIYKSVNYMPLTLLINTL